MDASNPNSATLEAYEKNFKAYLAHTPSGYTKAHQPLLRWIDYTISLIPPGGSVFEIGSATPREAIYMRSYGLDVTCSDAVEGFVKNLHDKSERSAIKLNILQDKIPGKFDLIFANAVFPHFTRTEFLLALDNISSNLDQNGIFAFSVKLGQGETWVREKFDTPRFIHYWQPDDLYRVVEDKGFTVNYKEAGTIGDIPTHIWINITAIKNKP